MIDLRSDTVTRPTAAMRKAMAQADVGDDVLGEDPTPWLDALANRGIVNPSRYVELFAFTGR